MSEMTIKFIGTGSAFNHEYGNNSALLEFNHTNLLLDCGYDVPKRLIDAKININEISNIWISHMHADHIGGIEEIAFMNKFLYNGFKPNLIIPSEFYEDFKTWFEATTKYGPEILTIEDYFQVFKADGKFAIGIRDREMFIPIKTDHIVNMPAYMLKGKNFIYTGDTKFVDWSKWDLDDINYIFQDTQLERYSDDDDVHASLPQLNELPLEIKKKIYCMHYGDGKKYLKQIIESNMHIVKPFEKIKLRGE